MCVFSWHVLYCMCLNLSSEFVLWNLSWTKWLNHHKQHNGSEFPVSAAMANMELLDEHSLAACGVLRYHAMQPKLVQKCPSSLAPTWHLPGTYPAHEFQHGCANMEPFIFFGPTSLVFGRVNDFKRSFSKSKSLGWCIPWWPTSKCDHAWSRWRDVAWSPPRFRRR